MMLVGLESCDCWEDVRSVEESVDGQFRTGGSVLFFFWLGGPSGDRDLFEPICNQSWVWMGERRYVGRVLRYLLFYN